MSDDMSNQNILVARSAFPSSSPYYASSGFERLESLLCPNGTAYNLPEMAGAFGTITNSKLINISSNVYYLSYLPPVFYKGNSSWTPCLRGFKPYRNNLVETTISGTYRILRGNDSSGDYILVSGPGTFSVYLRGSDFSEGIVPYVVFFELSAAGGGGAGGSGSIPGSGGGAGGSAAGLLYFGNNQYSFTVVLGAGGSAGVGSNESTANRNGGSGGDSSITVLNSGTTVTTITVSGGSGGTYNSSGGSGGSGVNSAQSYGSCIYIYGTNGGSGGAKETAGNGSTIKEHFNDDSVETVEGEGGTSRSKYGGGGGATPFGTGGICDTSWIGTSGTNGSGGGGGGYQILDGKNGGAGSNGYFSIYY